MPVYVVEVGLAFGTVPAQGNIDLEVHVTGATPGDIVNIGIDANSAPSGITYMGWSSNTNKVTIRASNITNAGIAIPSGTFTIQAEKVS